MPVALECQVDALARDLRSRGPTCCSETAASGVTARLARGPCDNVPATRSRNSSLAMCIRPPQILTGLLTLVTLGAHGTVPGQTGGSMRSVVPSPWVSEYVFGRGVSADGAFRWDATTGVVDLGTLGGDWSVATGVSDDGSVVVGSSTPFGSTRATTFRWEAGVYHPVGTVHCATATPNSTGAIGVLDVQGNNAAQTNFVRLVASNLPVNTVGYFITSQTAIAPMPVANSVGLLCLGGSIGRFNGPGQVLGSGSNGEFTLPLDLTSVPGPTGPAAIVQGQTWSFQC